MRDEADSGLLRRFAAGDDDAFREVVQQYSAAMFSVAWRTLGRRDLAADAVQQALVAAWHASGSFDAGCDIAPWLCTITRRCAIDLWRRERRHQGSDLDASREVAELAPGPTYEQVWEAWQVRQALDRLPPDERDVLRLHYLEGLTQTEIAARIDVPVGTVKSRASRAHRRLQPMLAHLGCQDVQGDRAQGARR